MDYDKLQHAAARQQLTLLGGVSGVVTKGADAISPALVLIERNVEVVIDNGMRTDRRDVASLLVAEVGTLSRGHKITVSQKAFDVQEVLDDDGYVVRVFVRG